MTSRVLLALCVAFGALATPALAQSPDALQKAQSAFDKAQLDYLAGKYDDAAAGFLEAYAARPFPQFLYNVGASYHMKGKKASDAEAYTKAVDYYKQYLSGEPNATDKAKVEKTIGVLEAEIKRIKDGGAGSGAAGSNAGSGSASATGAPSEEVQQLGDVKPRGLVVIETEPQDATIYLDDRKNGPFHTTPWSGSLDGEHKIILEKRGYRVSDDSRIVANPSRLLVLHVALAQASYLGWVDITSNVPGAEVFIDDKSVGAMGKTPVSQNIKPGKHTFWINAEGYDEYSETVDVAAGETHTVKGVLKGSPVGRLSVVVMDGVSARVDLDGKVLCEQAPCIKNVPQGDHELTVSSPDYKPYRQHVQIAPKTETAVKAELAKSPGHSDAIVAYVLAAAFGGVGIYLGVQSQNLHDELKKAIDAGNPPPDSNDPRLFRGKVYAWAADGTFALAGVTLLTAIYYTFHDAGLPSTGSVDARALALQPQVGPHYAGLGMGGSW